MTDRSKQIEKEATEYDQTGTDAGKDGFIVGANWADQNPVYVPYAELINAMNEHDKIKTQLTLTQKQLELAVGALRDINSDDYDKEESLSGQALAQIEELGEK